MSKAYFFRQIQLAAARLVYNKRVKKVNLAAMHHDGDLIGAARVYELQASGTPSDCPVSSAIVSAAYHRADTMRVLADAEGAWEHTSRQQKSAA